MFFDDVTTPKKDSNQRQYFAVTCTSDVTFSTIHLAWVHQRNMNLQRTHEDDIWLNKTIPAFWFIIGNTLIFTFAGREKILCKLRLLLVRDRRIGACHLKLFVFAVVTHRRTQRDVRALTLRGFSEPCLLCSSNQTHSFVARRAQKNKHGCLFLFCVCVNENQITPLEWGRML